MTHKLLRFVLGWLLAAFAITFAGPVAAQSATATASWSTAGAGSMTPMPNPTSITATDGTSVLMSYSSTTNGGSFVPVYGGSFLSYYSGQIGAATGPLLLSFDNDSYDPGDKVTITITLGRSVNNLRFSLSDIDAGSFRDAVSVEYDTGSGSFQNAAENSGFWTTGSAVTRSNDAIVNGWTGTSGSNTTSTNGNIDFNFGSTTIRRIRITYFSYSGSGDPSGQFAGVSDLTFDAPSADLSLAKTLIGSAPTNGGSVTWRLTLSSASTSTTTASGVVVTDYLPAGFTFASATGTGSFSNSTGNWTVGSITPGSSVSIDITGTISATPGVSITNTAEVTASSVLDPDSAVNNGAPGEDDYASSTFTVAGTRAAGVATALSCPAGTVIFDWDPVTWTSGSTDNSYALSTIGNIRFQLANPGSWLNNATVGGQSPSLQTVVTGGYTGQRLLLELVDLPDRNSNVTTTINLPAIMRGAQFRLADVDYASGQFADRVTVVGSYQGSAVYPILTNGVSNYVIGNSAYGDGASNSDSADGNVVVTFSSPIDTISIQYGNHSLAPTNPGQQGVAIHDFTFCRPITTISPVKSSTVISDPLNGTTNPKMIPGAVIEYCIAITNSGDTAATGVSASDILPAKSTYVAGSMMSGTSCATATTAEDDDNTGADESDPYGASVAGNTLTATAGSLAAGQTLAVKFRTTIN